MVLLVTSVLVPGQSQALNEASTMDPAFAKWLDTKVWADAKKKGVSRETFDLAFEGTDLDWSLPDMLKPGTKLPDTSGQSEFGNPSSYFRPANIDFLLKKAKKLDQEWNKTLTAVEKTYGVPRQILLAIWGRESGFGQAKLPHNAIQALASLSYAGARKEVFYPELLAALQILQQGHVPAGQLTSSWAGALGQPQFMPSKFLEYARDQDGDKKRNIWTSIPDTLASIAYFLKEHGWKPQRHWGFEILVPKSLSCSLEGPDQGKKVSEWQAKGIKRADKKAFPKDWLEQQGFLLMPAGRLGPAFLVSENFYVLKDYNESDLYALFIGHLGDRIQGGKPFVGQWQDVTGFKRAEVQAMQLKLQKQGHDVGKADGLVGFKTRRSIGRWQEKHKLKPTCFPDAELVKKITKS